MKWLVHLIGPVLFVAIITRIDLAQTMGLLAKTNPLFLAVAVTLNFFVLVVRSHRWAFLLQVHAARPRFFETLSVYACGVAIGTLTPGRVGEFIKILYLRRSNLSFGAAFFSVFFDRLFDIVFLVLFGGFSLFVFFETKVSYLILVLASAPVLSFIVYFIVTNGKNRSRYGRFLTIFFPQGWRERIIHNFQDFSLGVLRLSSPILVFSFAETVFSWLCTFFAIHLLALALGLQIGYWSVSAASAACALTSMLPVSILGLGTRDVVLIILLGRIGVLAPSALALSSLILLLNISYSAFCSGFLFTRFGKNVWQNPSAQ